MPGRARWGEAKGPHRVPDTSDTWPTRSRGAFTGLRTPPSQARGRGVPRKNLESEQEPPEALPDKESDVPAHPAQATAPLSEQEALDRLEDRFHQERIDPTWSASASAKATSLLRRKLQSNSRLTALECRVGGHNRPRAIGTSPLPLQVSRPPGAEGISPLAREVSRRT